MVLFMDKHNEFMRESIGLAKLALREGEIPVGAIVVKGDKIIGRGRNIRESLLDVSGHAEIVALKEAAETLGDWRLSGCSLYVTLEPCLMCAGAIMQSRIESLYFGALDPKEGAIVSNYHVFDKPSSLHRPLVYPGILSSECHDLIDSFFSKRRE